MKTGNDDDEKTFVMSLYDKEVYNGSSVLQIFNLRAATKEIKLQVTLAELR